MRRILYLLLPVALMATNIGVVSAQDIFAPRAIGVDRLIGIAAVAVPDYEGSDDYTFAAAPLFQYKFGKTSRYAQLVGNKLYGNLLNHENWEFGPLGVFRFGRDGDDIDDNVVKLMTDVDDSFELGMFLGYAKKFNNNLRHRMNIHFDISQDVTDGHDGFVGQLSGTYWQPVSPAFDIGFRANVTYASEDYMSSFFDVTAADATRSGLTQFDADAGFKDMGIALMGLLHFNKSWHMGMGVQYKALFGDASDSPVVDTQGDSNQFFVGLSLLYSW